MDLDHIDFDLVERMSPEECDDELRTWMILAAVALRVRLGLVFYRGPGNYETTERIGQWASDHGASLAMSPDPVGMS